MFFRDALRMPLRAAAGSHCVASSRKRKSVRARPGDTAARAGGGAAMSASAVYVLDLKGKVRPGCGSAGLEAEERRLSPRWGC